MTLKTTALTTLAALSLSAWSVRSDGACDRACLIRVTNDYLAAIVAHDPKAAPLAANVLFVENLKRLKPGEGIWASAVSGPTDFKVYVPDPVLHQAGFIGVLERKGDNGNESVMIAVRLKLDGNDEISEAEHIVAGVSGRSLQMVEKPRAGLVTDVPAARRMDHDKLARIGLSYYDALDDNDGTKMPFADDCERHENGMITSGPNAGAGPNADANAAPVARLCAAQLSSGTFQYIKTIDDRRLVAADPQTGLVMGLSHFHHPMDNLPYTVTHVDGSTSQTTKENFQFNPFDMPAAHIFKVGADGLVHEIEAVGVMAPLNSPTGREQAGSGR
jgi:hypothetical protein